MQSKRRSALEAVTNVTVGFLVAVGANLLVLPAFGYEVTIIDSFAIGWVFTVISMLRSYFLRRLLNLWDT
jgi:membrane protein CcdC involved in cytochrome C biogenesis